MQRMFSKADLNGDRLLDLNEFLWLVQGLVVHEGAASRAAAADEDDMVQRRLRQEEAEDSDSHSDCDSTGL